MRFPVEVVEGDLEDRAAVEKAARGCDAIVHLGVGERAEAETRPVVEAARKLGIRRFVHMSSAAVYGARIPASVESHQDRTPLRATGESYADEKAAEMAENLSEPGEEDDPAPPRTPAPEDQPDAD